MSEFLSKAILEITEKGRAIDIDISSSDWLTILRKNTKSVSDLRNELSELINIIEEKKDHGVSESVFIVAKNNQNVAAIVPLMFLENMLKSYDILKNLIVQIDAHEQEFLLSEAFDRWDNSTKRYSLNEVINKFGLDSKEILSIVNNQEGSLLE